MELPYDPTAMVADHGCPCFVYDLGLVRRQARALKEAIDWAPFQPLYAIKANPCPAVAKVLVEEGFGIDAVSPGEVALALRLGCPADRILFTENNMTDAEQDEALAAGVLVNAGSLDRLERLGRAGAAEAAVRFNPDIGDGEHAHVLTAGPLTKFGVHYSQVAEVRRIEAETGIKVVGCHMHIGSNVLDAATYRAAMRVILDVAKALPNLKWVDVGGGLGVPYREGQAPIDLPAVGRAAGELMADLAEAGAGHLELRIEPGRFLVAEAGVLLSTVTSVKQNPDGRIYVGCDTGFNHLIRPMVYGSYHPIANLTRPDAPPVVVDVVGNVCESGDVFARERSLPEPQLGDLLAIGFAGAYGMAMASTYNTRPLPAEVTVDGGVVRCVRPRRSVDDLLDEWVW
jgi:diaminopimelate decarboxylase